MAIVLMGIVPRHERRLRLIFSGALAAGAFTSTSYYSVTCTNSLGANPTVSAAIQVAGQNSAVELQLGYDLVQNGKYSVALTALPAADASTFTGSGTFFFGTAAPTPNVEPERDDVDALLYGVDIVWSGTDFLETADGDLAVVSGLANVQGAVQRRLMGSGLPWAPGYGPSLDEYVDAPSGSQLTARGAISADLLKDDRVMSATVTVRQDESRPSDVYFDVDVKLVGNRRLPPFPHVIRL